MENISRAGGQQKLGEFLELLDVIYVFAFLHMIDEAICRAPEAPLELQVCSQVGASCPRLGRTWIFWVSWISDG